MRRLSEQSLSNVALFYLRRYSGSRQGLVRMLERKVKRQAEVAPGEAKVIIEQVVARMVAAGYVDDARMAESKTASLHRQGKSSRAIELKLREKGIEPALAKKSALTTPEREFEAACLLVKKKRLGVDPERKQKDLAVLLRAGFSSEVARRAFQAAAAEADREAAARVIQLPLEGKGSGAWAAEECRVIQLPLPAPRREPEPAKKPARDLEAAARLVEKKRLGVDPERKQRDLAVLVRAGFTYDVARRALQATMPT